MTEQEKEKYAAALAGKAELSVKILKILAAATVGVAVLLFVYALVALKAFDDKAGTVIGLAVITGVLAVLIVSVITVIIYAYVTLNKLRKLK